MLQIQSRGHGVFAAPDLWTPNSTNGNFPGDDGIMYWPGGRDGSRGAAMPTGPWDVDASYALLWLDYIGGLWDRRYDLGVGAPFYSAATMSPSGDHYGAEFGAQYLSVGASRAKPPWAWDVDGDSALRGYFVEHPVGMALAYFVIPEFDHYEYLYNPYCGILCYAR